MPWAQPLRTLHEPCGSAALTESGLTGRSQRSQRKKTRHPSLTRSGDDVSFVWNVDWEVPHASLHAEPCSRWVGVATESHPERQTGEPQPQTVGQYLR